MYNRDSLVGHLIRNEILSVVSIGSGPYALDVSQLKRTYTNDTGLTIAQYTLVSNAGTSGDIQPCDPSDITKMPAMGIVSAAILDGESGNVVFNGPFTISTASFTPREPVYVGSDGLVTQVGDGNFPATDGDVLQLIGYAESATIVSLMISPTYEVIGA